MKICGIIAEYNPFHNGHAYQIQKLREQGITHIVAVMSSNFVQRGEAAVLDKYTRAKTAIINGVDLVLELPLPYCASTAQKFAFGGVSVLEKIGCVDYLGFGCEHDNINDLQVIANFVCTEKSDKALRDSLASGLPYAMARNAVVFNYLGAKYSSLMHMPNNILAIEYLRSMRMLRSKIEPLPVLREGAAHDNIDPVGNFASASLIRSAILASRFETMTKYLPENVYEIIKNEIAEKRCPATIFNCERTVLSKMRALSAEDFLKIPDVSEGLEHRIFESVKKSTNIPNLIINIKTKRYTHSRIRRIVLHSFLGVTRKDFVPIRAARVLAIGERGAEILSRAKKTSMINIYSNYSQVSHLTEPAKRLNRIEDRAYDLFGLCTPKVQPSNLNKTMKIVTLEERENEEENEIII